MNYLAHFHLAGDNEGLIVGALLGDFIKGPLTEKRTAALPVDIVRGIKLHRKIDAYVDQLPELLSLGNQLPSSLRRYKSILLDLFCDYALTHHWQQFDDRTLLEYTDSVLLLLDKNQHHLPPAAADLLARITKYELLNNYGQKIVIESIINRIGERLQKSSALSTAAENIWILESQWLVEFVKIYPLIKQFALTQRAELLTSNNTSLIDI